MVARREVRAVVPGAGGIAVDFWVVIVEVDRMGTFVFSLISFLIGLIGY